MFNLLDALEHFRCQLHPGRLDDPSKINVWPRQKFVYDLARMAEITLEKLRSYSGRSNTLVTVDAPLFGNVLFFNGQMINRGHYVKPEQIGQTTGFPAPTQIVAEATRFWIQDSLGIRQRKTRDEMARLLSSLSEA